MKTGNVQPNTKTNMGYISFKKPGLYLISLSLRWSAMNTNSAISTIAINKSSITPQYEICAYDNSNTQFSANTRAYVQQMLCLFRVTNIDDKAYIWVFHTNTAIGKIEVNFTTAVFLQ